MSQQDSEHSASEDDAISIFSVDLDAEKSTALAKLSGKPVEEWSPAIALRTAIAGFLLTTVHGGEPSVDNPTFAHLIQRGVLAKWPRRNARESLRHDKLRAFRDESSQRRLLSHILSFTGPIEYTEAVHNPLTSWRAGAEPTASNTNVRKTKGPAPVTLKDVQALINKALAAKEEKGGKKRKASEVDEDEAPSPKRHKSPAGGKKGSKAKK